MKKLTLFLATILCACLAIAQVPQTMNFQALIRNAENEVVTNQQVDVEVRVLNASQTAVYVETHSVTTSSGGVATMEIGAGTPVSGSFAAIDWAAGRYYLETRIQLPDGSDALTDVSPLLSVPYSLYAAKAGEVDIDLSEYAKKSDIPDAVDLSDYALKSEIPSEVSLEEYAKKSEIPAMPDLSGYALKSEIPAEVDLTDYAKKSDIPEAVDLSGYALKSEIPAEVDLTDYAKKSDIPEAVDLSGYALKSEIPAEVDLTGYALKSELPTVPDVTGFATKTEVSENYLTKETFENYVLGAGQPESVDLSVYAKTADVNAALATLESQIPDEVDLTDYAKSVDIESAYAKKSDLDGYALVSQLPDEVDLTDYAKSADIESAYAKKTDLSGYALVSQLPDEVDLTDYAKSADIESAYAKKTDLDGYALVSQIPEAVDLTDYALKSELPTVPDVTGFATKTEVSENYLTKETFENYVLGAGQPESVDLSVYAKTADVNAALATLESQIPEEVDLTDYAKSADIESAYAKKTDLNGYALVSQIPDEVDLTDYAKSADIESAYAKKTDLDGYALVSQIPDEVDLTDYAKTEAIPTKLSDLNNDVAFVKEGNNVSLFVNDVEYVKKSYVDSLFSIVFQKCDSLKTVLSNAILLVTSIELQEGSTKTLHVGDTYTMKEPIISEATNRSFTWSIEGEGATITEDGVVTVTGDAGGTFTIVATANDGSGVKGECVVTIIGKAVSKVSLGTGTITMLASESINFMDLLTIEPEGVSYTAIQWSVSGDNGSITQEGVFTADAQAVNNNGYSSYCSVTVRVTSIDNSSKTATRGVSINPDHPGYVASITIPSAITITKGHSYTFKSSEITVLPISANDKTYTWSVLTENAPATISSSGTITLTGAAQDGDIFVVAATANDGSGVRGECTVTVVAPSIAEPNEGAVPALFSVSESKTVYFSQGNLQYQASTGTWRFAENQYDKIGEDNKNASSSYTGWIDLFTWGSSGWKYRSTPYPPYGTSEPSVDNLTGENKDGDWGVYNAISNGGNQAGMWRTLTKEEWIYLFETRTDASSKYAHAQIDGVNGMILLPDTWELPENISFRSGSGDFSQNTYTVTQWSQLEDAGAVFLPAAGYKSSSTMDTYRGAYWSATAYSGGQGYWLNFYDGGYSPYSFDRYSRSVRLVQDAE